MNALFALILLIGRIFISAIFIWAGIGKIVFFNDAAQELISKGITFVPFLLSCALILEILGGLSILIGYYARIGALVLFFYLIPTTFIFHDFWKSIPQEVQIQTMQFLKNVNLLGGLLYVIIFGAGRWSVDWMVEKDFKQKLMETLS